MSYSSEVLADTPLAYWRLGDAAGATTFVDSSGNSRSGTYTATVTPGSATLLVGDADLSCDFSGTGYGTVADAAWMRPNHITVECWFRADSVTGDRPLVTRTDWNFGNSSTLRAFHLIVQGGRLVGQVVTNTGNAEIKSAVSSISTGTTYYAALTYDGTTVRLYLNATQVDSFAIGGTSSVVNPAVGVPLAIGADSVRQFGKFDGRIDEVAYYGTALSSTRIGDHYTAGTTASATTVSGGHVTETTTVNAGTVSTGTIVAGGHVTETSTVNAGVTGVLVTNLDPNPSMETTENWAGVTGSTNPTTSTEQASVGTKSLKVIRGAGTGVVIARRTNYSTEVLDGAGVYTQTIRIWAPSFVLDPRVRISGTGVTAYAGGPLVMGLSTNPWEQWVELSITFQWDGTGTALLDLLDQDVTSGAYFYADCSMAVKGPERVPYFDGDTADTATVLYNWVGTAHASRSTRLTLGDVALGGHVTGATTLYAGTVSNVTDVAGGHVTETTTPNAGTVAVVVGGDTIHEATTLRAGSVVGEGVVSLSLSLSDDSATLGTTPAPVDVFVGNGADGEEVTFTLVGTGVDYPELLVAELNEWGSVELSVTIPAVPVGEYELGVEGATSLASAPLTLTVTGAPLDEEGDLTEDEPIAPDFEDAIHWRLIDQTVGDEHFYQFPHNPARWTNPNKPLVMEHAVTTAPDGNILAWQADSGAWTFEFSGYLDTQAQYEALEFWSNLRRRFWLIDHRNKVHFVTFEHFDAQARIVPGKPWAHDYTIKAVHFFRSDWDGTD